MTEIPLLLQLSSKRFQHELLHICKVITPKLNQSRDLFAQLLSERNYSDLMHGLKHNPMILLKIPNLHGVLCTLSNKGESLSEIEVANAFINAIGRDNLILLYPDIVEIASKVRCPDLECIVVGPSDIGYMTKSFFGYNQIAEHALSTDDIDSLQIFYLAICNQTYQQYLDIHTAALALQEQNSNRIVKNFILNKNFPSRAATALLTKAKEAYGENYDICDVVNNDKTLSPLIWAAFSEHLEHPYIDWDLGFGELFISYLVRFLDDEIQYSPITGDTECASIWDLETLSNQVSQVRCMFFNLAKICQS